jgi:hypothetical protein
MTEFTNSDIGVKFPLNGLQIVNENEGWVVLKKDVKDNAFLSVLFTHHFFSSQDEAVAYIQNEIQKVADANDLYHLTGINKKGDDIVTAVWSQYINNVTHLVYIGIKILADHKGYYYMAVTNNDELAGFGESIFLHTVLITRTGIGSIDKATEKKLASHTLKYMHVYSSHWGSGGGTSTERSYTLHPDHSFRYSYSSVVSFGSMGGSTSEDEGWGMWEVQKNNNIVFLLLRWHLKPVTAYQLEWGEPGIVFLGGEKFLIA